MTQKEQIADITAKLEEGVNNLFLSDNYKNYLDTMSKFHNYSFNNNLLIAMQKPDATFVAGYESWNKNFDRHVLKGEKAIKIIAPAPYKKIEEKPILDSNGKQKIGLDGIPLTEKVEHIMPGFKVTNVFDISQTTGKDLPSICRKLDGSSDNYQNLQEAVVRYSPVSIEYKQISGGANGYYNNETKSIVVKEGMSDIQTLKTSVHEVAHSILHDKDSGVVINVDSRTKEVQAESVAYTVCQHYGIDTSDYSFGYIGGWSSGKDLKELKASMQTIQKTANGLITGIDEQLNNIRLEQTKEIAYKFSDGYLSIQESSDGYDFTFYNKDFSIKDGGQLDNPALSIAEAAKEALTLIDHSPILGSETDYTELQNSILAHELEEMELSHQVSMSH